MTGDWSFQVALDDGDLDCHPFDPGRLTDLDEVFGVSSVARRCYCMHWRRPDGGFGDKRDNRERFVDVVADLGRAPGLIGYLDRRPVGWVQVGPRSDFPTVDRSRLLKREQEPDSWSINCFVTRVGYRRRGIAGALLAAALDFARHHGATLVEGYPVDGPRSSVVDYFTGTLGMFADEGFVEVLRRSPTRPVVTKYLLPDT